MIKYFLFLLVLPVIASAQLQRYTFTQPKMGSYFTLVFYDRDSLHAGKMAEECFSLVDSLNQVYSDYLPGSELNRLCATAGTGQWVPVSPALLDILSISRQAWIWSRGSFDITVGPVVKLWRKARKEHQFPNKDSVRMAMQSVGFRYVSIDSVRRCVLLKRPGMQLDLGGIGQGYIGQKVSDYLRMNNIPVSLVDVSGDIIAGDPPPSKAGWTIAVNVPESTDELLNREISIHNRSIITSGDVYQYLLFEGKKYSHIVDPKTGYGVTNQRNVTVIAADGITADWFTKACTILSLKQIRRLAKKLQVDYLIGTVRNEKLHFYTGRNFANYWIKR